MASEPLEQDLSSAEGVPTFNSQSTACWRGYMGNWKTKDNKLYLTALNGFIRTTEEDYKPVDLNYLFPNKKKVFADWFSDEIRIPLGRTIHYVHMGYESVYEKELLINIKNGYVISRTEISNPKYYLPLYLPQRKNPL